MPRKKDTDVKKVVVISDLHVGSTLGLLPPGFVTHEGNEIIPNKIQKWLWDCWSDIWINWLPSRIQGQDWVLVVNGDLVDGVHHGTTQIISNDVGDHVRACQLAMEMPLRMRPTRLYITEGTESHTRNTEAAIGKAVGSEIDKSNNRHAFEKLYLSCHGNLCCFFHHMPTTSRPYLEAGAMSIVLGVARQEAARNNMPIPSVVCCAHRHRHGHFSDGCGMLAVTGPWQALTRYGMRVVPSAVPSPSCIVLDWSEKQLGELPRVDEKIYRPKASDAHIIKL